MGINPAKLRSLAAKSSCIQLVYEWASCEMPAVDIWKKEEDYGTCPDHEWFIWQLNEMQLPGSPVIPNLVLDQIEYHMTSILKQVTDWICHHHRKNFFHDDPASALKQYLLKLIWKPNCTIDYAATAKNVLVGSNFNDMEKYRFACTYCFSEEVCNLKDMAEVTIDLSFEAEPLLVYWSKYLANQLDTISLPANDSLDEIMFAKALNVYDLWQPIKYFFEKSNSGARLLQCKKVLMHKDGKYQQGLLAVLNECEKCSVYQANLKEIIKNYIKVNNLEGIVRIYAEMKSELSFEHFAVIIEELARLSANTGHYFNPLTRLLMEIWNDASDQYKRRVVSTGLRTILGNIWSWSWSHSVKADVDDIDNPLMFIRALADVYEPRNFLKENFYWLVLWQSFTSVLKLLDEYQFSAEEIEELKRDTRRSDTMKYICSANLRSGDIEEFNSIVSFCYSDDDASRIAFQRKFLRDHSDDLSDGLCRTDWRIVREFVNDVFRDTDDDGFVSSYTTKLVEHVLEKEMLFLMDRMYVKMYPEEANSVDVLKCIEAFVPHQRKLSRAKKTCIDSLFKCLHNDSFFVFKETQVEKMLIWSYGTDETGVAKFKEKINVSKCFVSQLYKCDKGDTFKATDSMEEFLRWYYPLENERKAFKLEMIHSYGKFEEIGKMLKQRKYRRPMLNWFFENDACKINEFITKISG
ncbi:uncharacterized protein LOC135837930 [Planococcus citri]|uniref:uncharacterized protein LOC135837930 n=1 Tax=Planococcus citri TaxID=170843 RepID=UPI0031F9437C